MSEEEITKEEMLQQNQDWIESQTNPELSDKAKELMRDVHSGVGRDAITQLDQYYSKYKDVIETYEHAVNNNLIGSAMINNIIIVHKDNYIEDSSFLYKCEMRHKDKEIAKLKEELEDMKYFYNKQTKQREIKLLEEVWSFMQIKPLGVMGYIENKIKELEGK